MPGSSLQLASASFANSLKASLTCPDRTGLIGEYLLRENATRTVRNIANPALPATLTGAGTPVYNANSVLLSSSASYGNGIAGLNTGLSYPPEFTLIAVRKKTAIGDSGPAPWFGSQPSGLYMGLMEFQGWDMYNGASSANTTLAEPTDTAFHFIAGTTVAGGKAKVYVSNSGVISSAAATVSGAPYDQIATDAAVTIKLCSGTPAFQMELAYAAIYNRVLSADQISAVYTTLKAYLASRSVVV